LISGVYWLHVKEIYNLDFSFSLQKKNAMNSNNRKNKNRKASRKRRGRGNRNRASGSVMTANMRQAQAKKFVNGKCAIIRGPIADSVMVDLFYLDTVGIRNNVGGTVLSWRYRVNSAFDPDPLLGTGALSGFLEWAAMYTHYRVVDFGYDVSLSNLETFPLIAAIAPTLLDVGPNYVNFDQFPEFPYGRKSLLSVSGGQDRCRFRGSVDIAKLEGTTESMYDSTFSSQVTTNPIMLRFFNIGCSGVSNVFVKGVFLSVRLRYRCLFYARTNVPN